ncbi:MAG: ATP-binding protein [bacterium]
MKKIRTKLVLSLLVITLLPVFPIYFLVKNLLQQSLEIGFNKKVETALEHATQISRQLNSHFKAESLALAKELARSNWVQSIVSKNNRRALKKSNLDSLGKKAKIDIFGRAGQLLFSHSAMTGHAFPKFYQNDLNQMINQEQATVLNMPGDRAHIVSFAPILVANAPQGFLVLTTVVDANFLQGSQQIVDVNQMFKTLNFFEDQLTHGFIQSFFAVYAPIAILSVAIGYYFSRKITQPLLQLVEGTQKVAAGNWEHRVQVQSRDEVGELVAAFNKMVSTLKEKQDRVVALEKMAVWREIARILAHEIKNPLTPIQLTVQQMKDKYTGDDATYRELLKECSEIVRDEIEGLRTLVREFSEFARMPGLNPVTANLNELVEEVSKLYTDSDLQTALDASLPEFEFDQEKLRRVLINLIENALDSVREKGAGNVHISTSLQKTQAHLQVKDSGGGISEELIEKIFEPYFSTKKSGVGLGLAIVKRIVEEHGGRIAVESALGEGTTFEISLPVSR